MARKKSSLCPFYKDLIKPVFKALIQLGGSGTNNEILKTVIEIMQLPENVVDELHNGSSSQETELEFQLAWARTYLKKYNVISNSARGVWSITPEYADKEDIDDKAVIKYYDDLCKKGNGKDSNSDAEDLNPDNNTEYDNPEKVDEPWRTELAEALHSMSPYGFENLTKRLLRESGFTDIIVTQGSGDHGIDGTGIYRLNDFLSFNVAFQCKRYSGSVSVGEIRDFRGALTADIEKGIFITTGTFTNAAIDEATISGKQQIELIDGEKLIDKLIEYGIGIHEKTIYEVDKDFFEKI